MSKVSKDEIAAAKEIDLLTWLQMTDPGSITKEGQHDYRSTNYPTLVISDNGFWNWTDHGFGGKDALNYLIKVEGRGFIEAVRMINGTSQHSEIPRPVTPPREPVEFKLPKRDDNFWEINHYLRNRQIKANVIGYCIQEGILYQTSKGKYKNCVFVGRNPDGKAKYANLRSTSGDFRGDVMGSQKGFPFFIAASKPSTVVEVFEAPVDALSGASIHILNKEDWHAVHYLALGGLNGIALDGFLKHHPEIETIRLCLDADTPGREFTKKLMAEFDFGGRIVEDCPPTFGKDINDMLVHMVTESSQAFQELQKVDLGEPEM